MLCYFLSAIRIDPVIPSGLRLPLIAEYQSIVQNFLEHRWLPSELSGGRFSEIVYTILDGFAKKTYSSAPKKPTNFKGACSKLENNAGVPRSFQILIPRLLPALYEIRNNRSVGHVGGDVDPNHMDSAAVLAMCNWVMCELVRVYHSLPTTDAQKVVDSLAEMHIPVVWSDGNIKRVLQPKLKLPQQLLLLIATSVPDVSIQELIDWTEYKDKKHFMNTVRTQKRWIEFTESIGRAQILPPGTKEVEKLVREKGLSSIV
jgi:hypothetical protein